MSKTDDTVDDQEPFPTVAVLLPVYNGDRYLAEQLDSILRQQNVNVDVNAIDDGSTDGSFALLQKYAVEDKRVTVERHADNRGLIKTLGELLGGVTSTYVALADQDDIWDADKLTVSVQELERSGAYAVYSDVRICDAAGSVIEQSYWSSRGLSPYRGTDSLVYIFRNPAVGHTLVFRSEVAHSAASFLPHLVFHEPWLLAEALALGEVSYVDRQLGTYRQHGNNVVGPRLRSISARLRRVTDPKRFDSRQRTRYLALRALARHNSAFEQASQDLIGHTPMAMLRYAYFLCRHVRTLSLSVVLKEAALQAVTRRRIASDV